MSAFHPVRDAFAEPGEVQERTSRYRPSSERPPPSCRASLLSRAETPVLFRLRAPLHRLKNFACL
jgi:hypothetical protein